MIEDASLGIGIGQGASHLSSLCQGVLCLLGLPLPQQHHSLHPQRLKQVQRLLSGSLHRAGSSLGCGDAIPPLQLRPGEDAFSLFEKTGIAGVPGSGFGYTDDYVRFSIGVIPVPEPPLTTL